jgi:hypothetical protein
MHAFRGLILACLAFAAAPAIAEPLKVRDILKHIEGDWGWEEKEPGFGTHSCNKIPTHIWLEEGGTIYKSRDGGDPEVVSKVGLPSAGKDGDHILISYMNKKQVDLFGVPVVWSLSMPDKDTFVWKQVPWGGRIPPLHRCPKTKKTS